MTNRWWTYQKERFPLAAHAPLVLVLTASTLAYAAASRGATSLGWLPTLAAFVSALLLFFQLRVADEFKDFDEDKAHRPYRPVPRGLVKLGELRALALAAALVQAILAWLVDARLLLGLAILWSYLLLMTKEFFVAEWLKKRIVLYTASHMVILALLLAYVAAFDILPASTGWPTGLGAFLAMGYFGGIVMEIGRKLRAPADEEPGVETYSALWGRPRAVSVWLGAMLLTCAAVVLSSAPLMAIVPLVALLGSAVVARAFLGRPTQGAGKRIEIASALFLLVTYLSAGFLPLALEAAA